MRLLLSLQSLVIIIAGVILATTGGIYGAERFGDWTGEELGFAAAIACGLGIREEEVIIFICDSISRSCFDCSWLARSSDLLLQVLLLVLLLQHHSPHHHHFPVSRWGLGPLLLVSCHLH